MARPKSSIFGHDAKESGRQTSKLKTGKRVKDKTMKELEANAKIRAKKSISVKKKQDQKKGHKAGATTPVNAPNITETLLQRMAKVLIGTAKMIENGEFGKHDTISDDAVIMHIDDELRKI